MAPDPRAQLYAVNPDAAHVAALDVTPARILAAVADLTGRTVGRVRAAHAPPAATGRGEPRPAGVGGRLHVCRASGLEPPPPRHRDARCVRPHHAPTALRPPPPGLARPTPARAARRRGRDPHPCRQRRQPRCGRRARRGCRPRRRGLRPALGRRGARRRDRDRRPAPRRSDRRSRRGGLPAAARHSSGARRPPRQRRSLPGARGRTAGAGAGPLLRDPRGLAHDGRHGRPHPPRRRATSCSPSSLTGSRSASRPWSRSSTRPS